MGERTANPSTDLDAKMREHMRAWAQRLTDGTDQRDPVEDTADEIWRSLRVFADQYLELFAEADKWRGIADQLAAALDDLNNTRYFGHFAREALDRYREAAR